MTSRVARRSAITLLAGALFGFASLATPGSEQADPGDEGHFLDAERSAFAADADAEPFAGPAPLTVRFTARTLNARGRVVFAWDFDDGTRSSEQNPVHTFRKRGWYLVVLDARDAAGGTYRVNLQLHAWRLRDWERFQTHRDMRIPEHAARELERKRRRTQAATTKPPPPVPR